MDGIKKEAGHKFLAKLGKTRLRPGGKKATEWLFKHAHLTPQSHVLEIACNMGTTAIEMASRYQCHVVGIDMDKSALAKARDNITQHGLETLVSVQEADASKLPFADNSFDVVINEAMLTMYANKAKSHLLKEYLRVLKPGGKLLTHDIMLHDPQSADEIIARIKSAINVNAQPISKPAWIELFQQAGFDQVITDNGAMTLMSPRGLIADEGFCGTLRIIRNAIRKQNRRQFITMFKTFRRNRHQLNYLAVCSSKPLNGTA